MMSGYRKYISAFNHFFFRSCLALLQDRRPTRRGYSFCHRLGMSRFYSRRAQVSRQETIKHNSWKNRITVPTPLSPEKDTIPDGQVTSYYKGLTHDARTGIVHTTCDPIPSHKKVTPATIKHFPLSLIRPN